MKAVTVLILSPNLYLHFLLTLLLAKLLDESMLPLALGINRVDSLDNCYESVT